MLQISSPFELHDQYSNSPHVVIIGGGITGLSAAFYLQRAARAAGLPVRYTLVDRGDRFGGKLVTETVDDFVVEGGPDSFITQKPWGLQLARELGLADQLIGTSEPRHKVYVLIKGRPRPMPDGLMLVVPTKIMPFALSSLISPLGKLRMGLDLFIPPRRDGADETMANFIRRRLGAEALDKIAEPLLAGIHNSESERQSILATFPRLREIEEKHGSLIRGMVAQRHAATSRRRDEATGRRDAESVDPSPPRPLAPSSTFVTLKGGLGVLVDALVDALDGRLIGGCGVAALDHDPAAPRPYRVRLDDGETLEADVVILTAPSFVSAELLAPLAPDLAEGLRQIRYVTTGTVTLAYRKSEIGQPLDGYGLVIPHSERRRINAVTITSDKFAHRAPDDCTLVRVFVGGSRNPDVPHLDDQALLGLVRAELGATLGIRAEPLWSRIYRWARSNPQYDVGHLDRMDMLEALCPDGLYLSGSAYRGVGIPDCVRQGKETAARVVAQLQQLAPTGERLSGGMEL